MTDEFPNDWQPDDEDFLPSEEKPWSPLRRKPSRSSLKPSIVLILCWIILSQFYWQDSQRFNFAASGVGLDRGYYWQLLTACFVHADWLHILSNSYLFLIFGWLLRDYYGKTIFPYLSLILGCLTNLIVVSYYPPEVRLVGASGIVYAMIALWLVLYIAFETGISMGKRIFFALGFAMIILLPSSYQKQTSYLAHGVGFILGLGAGGIAVALGLRVVKDE